MSLVRTAVKRTLEFSLVRSGLPRLVRALMRRRTLVLAYHNVVPDDMHSPGERSLHLARSSFVAQLDLLLSTHEVVPLTELLKRSRGAPSRPSVAITFDDGYRGAVTIGVEELARRGMPATIFVCPAFIGGHPFWWDTLTPPGAPGLEAGRRSYLLRSLQGRDTVVREWARRSGIRSSPVPELARAACEEELRVAVAQAGITLGSHTWSHANLTAVPEADLDGELGKPLEWLRTRFASVIPWLSYPYGLTSRRVEHAAAGAGYTAALRIEGGWVPRRVDNPYGIPRFNVPAGLSLDGFLLRVAAVLRG